MKSLYLRQGTCDTINDTSLPSDPPGKALNDSSKETWNKEELISKNINVETKTIYNYYKTLM